MRSIELRATVPACAPADAFDRLSDFSRFPELCQEIRSITQHPGEPRRTDWSVEFRQGLLSWTEREVFDHENLCVEFDQIDGDFADFRGTWRVAASGDGSEIVFEVTYDFGIESLAGAMDPIAERLLLRVVGDILDGLFDGVVLAKATDPEALSLAQSE
ncbi:SRPBCC family protein [Lentzea sp. NPDC003310]|uniref:type II toxin-antitoxin system RatA family toxin n=1 Tax=Lentzea sp. NPDC003310 TaxID=3154447 RepID=UPI0033A87F67